MITDERIREYFALRPKILHSEIVDNIRKLKKLSRKLMTLAEFAFDTEDNTLRVYGPNKDFKLVGISISWGRYNNYYIPVGHAREEDYGRQLDLDVIVKWLKKPFEREDIRLVMQNAKFDMHVMERVGIHIRTTDIWDDMIMSWLCDENTPNGLKENSAKFLGFEQTHFKEVTDMIPNEVKKQFGLKANSRATFDLALIDDAAPYAIDDAFTTWELYLGFQLLLEDEKMDKIYRKVYQPFIQTLFKMESHGVKIDREHLNWMSVEIHKDMEELEYKMYELAGVKFNPGSSQQLAELLFGYRKPPKEKVDKKTGKTAIIEAKVNEAILSVSFKFHTLGATKAGAPSTASDVIWKLSHMNFKNRRKKEGIELCQYLSQYKKLAKLNSAFIEGIEKNLYDDGKVHCTFNITGTDSGRLSCSNINGQQLPKSDDNDKYKIRALFIGDTDSKGHRKKIISCDQSNLEIRVTAHFSEDPVLIDMFKNNRDVHGTTACAMFGLDCDPSEVKKKYPHLRQAGKIISFLIIYGGGAYNLYNQLKDNHDNPVDLGDQSYLDTYHVKNGEDVAQIYMDKYLKSYSGVAEFIKHQHRFAHKHGYVYTLLKRKRRLPDINSSDYGLRAYNERLSVNSPVQGSAADLMMSIQNEIDGDTCYPDDYEGNWFEDHECFMLLQIHDEVCCECPEEYVEEARKRIEWYFSHPFGAKSDSCLNLQFKGESDSGDNYFEAK